MRSSRFAVVVLAGTLGSLAFAGPAPAKAAHLVFGACSAEQTQAASRAYSQAAGFADKGVKAAAATGVSSSDPAFIEWFGIPNQTNVPRVLSTLTSTQKFIQSPHVLSVLCTRSDDVCGAGGAVAPELATGTGDALALCDSFFHLPATGEDSASVTLLRELTFLAGHTNDDTLSSTSAKALAKGNPPTALGEAANYAYYSALGYSP